MTLYRLNQFSNVKIAQIAGVSEKCVRTTIKNFAAGLDYKEASRAGRPKKLTDRDENYIFRKARACYKWSNKDFANDFNSTFGDHSISRELVRRTLKAKKIESFTAIKKPLLTVRDRLKRIKWCRERKYWTVNDWANVIFSDESNFEVFNRKGRVLVKRYRSEKFSTRFVIPRLQGGGGSAGIWGCITNKGTGVCDVYTGRINQFSYIKCLEECLLPSTELFFDHSNFIYQQDGAPAHTANSVSDWFREQDIRLLPWCPRSPDLNPIENVWAWMDAQMIKTHVTSVEHLKEILHETWLKVPVELCRKLVESMPRRIKACLANKGGHFKY